MSNIEYYTTQSLATAAAAIEQGFEGCLSCYRDEMFKGTDSEWSNYEGLLISGWLDAGEPITEWRFPRTPHNEALMEVQLKDWCHYILYLDNPNFNDGYLGMIDGVYGQNRITLDNYQGTKTLTPNPYLTSKHLTIIHRNNKPFPVWDKDGV